MLFRSTVLALIFIAGSAVSLSSAWAASSPWFTTAGGKMRIVTSASPDSLEIRAALEVRLKKGWKTYWRSPGDSGIPPQFSFFGSSNVADLKVSFPVPKYFSQFGVISVGYDDRVVFPLTITMQEKSKPTDLVISLLIGICAEICIPVQAKMEVTEKGIFGPSAEEAKVLNDGDRSLPGKPATDFRVVRANWSEDNPRELNIESLVPDSVNDVQLHIEGPSGWYLLPAKLTEIGDGKAQFVLDISDIPEDAKPAATELRFTLVSGKRGIEQLITPEM